MITPKDFKTVFGRFNSKFAGYAQHDSCEALGALMDNLHEDLNRVKKKPVVEPVEDEGKMDSVFLANASWNGFKKRNDSVVVDTCFGQDKSELWCPDCMKDGKSRRKFDPRLTVRRPCCFVNHLPRLTRKYILGTRKSSHCQHENSRNHTGETKLRKDHEIRCDDTQERWFGTRHGRVTLKTLRYSPNIVDYSRSILTQGVQDVLHCRFIESVEKYFGSRHHHRLRDIANESSKRQRRRKGGR